jgi:hypothetical protein
MRDNRDTTPPVVKAMAASMGPHAMSSCGADMARRLLTDRKMQNVWSTLQRIPAKPYASTRWERLVKWPIKSGDWQHSVRAKMVDADPSPQDKACAGFFYLAMLAFGGMNLHPPMWTRSELEESAAALRSAAQMCLDQKRRLYDLWFIEAKEGELFPERAMPPAEFDVELATALEIVGELLETRAKQTESPAWRACVIERSGRSDDKIRVGVRVLAAETHKLFGKYLFGTLASVATVALALPTAVPKKSVENWCSDLLQEGSQ